MTDQDLFRVSNKACIYDEDKVLLLQNHSRVWELPGGHLDREDENVNQGLSRELREETGMELVSSELVRLHTYQDSFAMFWVCRVRGDQVILSEEHEDYEWVPIEELESYELTFRELRDFIQDWAPMTS